MASLTGRELYCSVGTGHVATFCRVANHGAKTNEKEIEAERYDAKLRYN